MRIAEIFDLGHSSGYDRWDRGGYGRGRRKGYGHYDRGRRYGRRRHRGGGLLNIRIGGY